MFTLLAQIKNPTAPNLSPKTSAEGILKFGNFLQKVISILLMAGIIAFFFMFLLGAIRWIMSGGDKNAVESARNQIMHALVGLIIMFAIFAIVKVLEIFFQTCILNIDLSFSGLTNTNCDRGGGSGPEGNPSRPI